MKLIVLGLLLSSGHAIASAAEFVKCSDGKMLSVTGTIENESLIATVRVVVNGVETVNAANLNYQKTDGFFSLVKNEAAQSFKYGDIYFVPTDLGIAKDHDNMVFLWLPIMGESGKPNPVLVSTYMKCE